jgi:hypothetical protein
MNSNNTQLTQQKPNILSSVLNSADSTVYAVANMKTEEVTECIDKVAKIFLSCPNNIHYFNSILVKNNINYVVRKIIKKNTAGTGKTSVKDTGKPAGFPSKHIMAYAKMSDIFKAHTTIPVIDNAVKAKDYGMISSIWSTIKKVLDEFGFEGVEKDKFSDEIARLVNNYDSLNKDQIIEKLNKINDAFYVHVHESSKVEDGTLVKQIMEDYIKNRYLPTVKTIAKNKDVSIQFKKKEYDEYYPILIQKYNKGETNIINDYDTKRDLYDEEFTQFFNKDQRFSYYLPDKTETIEQIEMDTIKDINNKIGVEAVTLIHLYFICKCVESKSEKYNAHLIEITPEFKSYDAIRKSKKKTGTSKKQAGLTFSYTKKNKGLDIIQQQLPPSISNPVDLNETLSNKTDQMTLPSSSYKPPQIKNNIGKLPSGLFNTGKK